MGFENDQIGDSYWTQREDNINRNIDFNGNEAIKLVMPPLHYTFNSDTATDDFKEKSAKKIAQSRKSKAIKPFPEVSFTEPPKEEKEKFVIEIVGDDEENRPDPCMPNRLIKPVPNKKRWHYEITEANGINTAVTATPTIINSGYFPEIPKQANKEGGHSVLLNTGKKNQTNTLQTILSKYNIYSNDKLKNYEASRRTQMHFLPVQLNTPKRNRNRQNNLPVDPLIAVLLSNYGVYLPQFYKANNGYKNLYGHLAFHNIHNNNPTGNYKLFSDTDYESDDSLNQQQ